ncbi:hypothetical protein ACFLUA_03015 [Chloroflexota bacterium]
MRSISGDTLEIDRKLRARTPSLGVQNRAVEERLCDFEDVVVSMDAESAMLEAACCVQCPVPAPVGLKNLATINGSLTFS